MVAINPAQTVRCKKKLEGSPVHVGAAIGFPLGQTTLECKIFETKDAIEKGADEIDYVINVAELKNKNYDYIKKEMEEIVKICTTRTNQTNLYFILHVEPSPFLFLIIIFFNNCYSCTCS